MTLTVTKIYDYGCPVCEAMSAYDSRAIAEIDPAIKLTAIELGRLLDPDNKNPFENVIAQLTERYACNPDYTIDLPAYIVTRGKSYVGHVVGEHVPHEFKNKLQGIVTDATNTEGEGRTS